MTADLRVVAREDEERGAPERAPISFIAFEALAEELDRLKALVERQERELAQAQESRDAWQERARGLADRVTEIHVSLYAALDGIRESLTYQSRRIKEMAAHIDEISQQVTVLNLSGHVGRDTSPETPDVQPIEAEGL